MVIDVYVYTPGGDIHELGRIGIAACKLVVSPIHDALHSPVVFTFKAVSKRKITKKIRIGQIHVP